MLRAMSLAFIGVMLMGAGCQKKSAEKKETDPGMQSKPMDPGQGGKSADPMQRTASTQQASPRLVQRWAATGLKVPESVLHDPVRKVIYVSCINGKPTEKNGKGFIAKLSPSGQVVALEWATGMNAPKGMGIKGDTLYVTDIDRLHAIDVKTGKIRETVDAPGAKFLNDIAIGPDGKVYVSDMVTGTIHVLEEKKLPDFVNLKSFKGANGMLMQGAELLVGTATGIVKVDLASKKATMHVPVQGFGMIDGLKASGADGYLMSNWKGRTQLVSRAGKVTVLLDTSAKKIQSADFEYIAEKRLLLIPTFFDNRVVAYHLEP